MIKIDLITGFLGVGKTTFIKKYVEYLTGCGYRIGIIENDFGAVNVDMLVLQDVLGDACDVEQIVGGQVVEDWKRRFRTKLISMAMRGFDRILVEPSGIYDVDAFFDVCYEEPVDSLYEIGNIFTIVDAGLEEELSRQEEYLLVSQIANAGKVIFSKVQEVPQERPAQILEHLHRMLVDYRCDRKLCVPEEVLCKNWNDLGENDFRELLCSGHRKADHEKPWFDHQESFSSLFFMNVHMTEEQISKVVKQLFQDPSAGTVLRVKGYVPGKDGMWLQINATKEHCVIQEVLQGQEIIIVIGQSLNKDQIQGYWQEA